MPLISNYVHGQFCWVELVAIDMPTAIEFYCKAFGWKTIQEKSDNKSSSHVQFDVDGKPVAGLLQMSSELKGTGVPAVWNTYVRVEDLSFALDKTVQLGGSISCPAMDAGEHGQVAFIKDPTGGICGLWQPGPHGGMSVRGDVNSVCWNELATRDAKAACEFYGALMEWTYDDNPLAPSPYFMIRSSDGLQIGGIMQMTEEWGETPSHWSIYFHVDAVDALAACVQQMNGTLVVPPFDTPVGRIAVLADQQGAGFNVIKLEEIPVPEAIEQ